MRVLCVGVATLDIVNCVAAYPPEDSEVRALGQSRRLGGNAANTAVVLAQLGVEVSWAGNLGHDAALIDASFARVGVDNSLAIRHASATTPTSYVTLNTQTGTRTIVHYRELPEYAADAFAEIDLANYDWIHFEGRAVDQLVIMLDRARKICGVPLSLEIEKPRPGIDAVFERPDWLFFSHDYARAVGYENATALLQKLPPRVAATCTWGSAGAWAIDAAGQLSAAPAPRLERVVDTLGAGDVFNAAMVFALGRGKPLENALRAAVGLASAQCCLPGLVLAADSAVRPG